MDLRFAKLEAAIKKAVQNGRDSEEILGEMLADELLCLRVAKFFKEEKDRRHQQREKDKGLPKRASLGTPAHQ